MMAEKRIITNPVLRELGQQMNSSRVLLINTNGEVVNSGLTLQEVMSGVVDLNADDIAQGEVHKFVTQGDLDTLGFIVVSDNVDLDWLNDQVRAVNDADLAEYFLNQF